MALTMGAAPAAPAAPLTPPAWYPAGFDLDAAAQGARSILESQGVEPSKIGPGTTDSVVFTDVDLTLVKTSTPTPLKNKTTGEYLMDPANPGHMLLLGVGADRDQNKELTALKAKYPNVKWDDYGMDYGEFGSIAELLRQPANPRTMDILRAADKADPKNRDIVITARSDDRNAPGLKEYLARRDVAIDGVFAVNNPGQTQKLGVPTTTPPLTSAQKKALAMAAVLKLDDPQSSQIRHVRFMDDTDDNLKAAMQLLPRLFPNVQFEFTDVIHTAQNGYVPKTVARSGAAPGELDDARGKVMDDAAIQAYASKDAPFKPDPILGTTRNPG
jgi:hypothetical protein